MRIFVTGASGFIGSAVVSELLTHGHEVLGLARSDEAAAKVAAAGAQAHRGDLDDLASLRAGAAASDGVIHLAFIHDFSNFAASVMADKLAIETIGEVLAGSEKPLIVTSGLALGVQGRPATEDDAPSPEFPRVSEQTALAFTSRGVRASAIRLSPSVHGKGDHGFVPRLVDIARAKGVSAYIADGGNHWAGVHRLDAAQLYRLAMEQRATGIFHGVAEEGVPTREIAEAIGRGLNVSVSSIPREEAGEHFGFLGMFFGMDLCATSAQTRERLGWSPVQPGLIADIEANYFAPAGVRAGL